MKLSEALARLRHTPEFKIVMESDELKQICPRLREMNPKVGIDEQAAQALFDSGGRRVFELVTIFLRGK